MCTSLLDCSFKLANEDLHTELNNRDIDLELELILCDNEYIKNANKDYRNIDKVTDVLSFPLQEMKDGSLLEDIDNIFFLSFLGINKKSLSLGTIVLSVDKVFEQAKEYNHSVLRESAFLITHSILHLLGYDHMNIEERREMENKQDAILNEVKLTRDVDDEGIQTFIENFEEYKNKLPYEDLKINYLIETDEDNDDYQNNSYASYSEDLEEPLLNENIKSEELNVARFEEIKEDNKDFKFGYVSILGKPNVGKSSLLNTMVGQNLAIISHKAQTTRRNIKAIVNRDKSQIVITDTPGMNKADSKLGRFMEKSLRAALDYSDLVIFLIDASFKNITDVEKRIINLLKCEEKKVILVINKIDKVSKDKLLPLIAKYSSLYDFAEIVPISVHKDDGIDILLDLIEKHLEYGEAVYELDQFTDQSERSICAELLREQILKYTHKEIPHGTAVAIEKFEELNKYKELTDEFSERSLVRITAVILCEKSSHKGILIGKNSESIKRILSSARIKMEETLECKVYLDCHIKIKENWKNKDQFLKDFGYGIEDDNLMREIL